MNELLKGEKSAVETYVQVLEKMGDQPKSDFVRGASYDHMRAVEMISDKIASLGGKPENSSGVWGTWAKVYTGTSKIFGDQAALDALKQGEEHGLKQYQELEEKHGDEPMIEQITDTMIPKQKQHIETLTTLINGIAAS